MLHTSLFLDDVLIVFLFFSSSNDKQHSKINKRTEYKLRQVREYSRHCIANDNNPSIPIHDAKQQ